MTPREKGWLKHIQAMQLHSDTPYRDDYYYVVSVCVSVSLKCLVI